MAPPGHCMPGRDHFSGRFERLGACRPLSVRFGMLDAMADSGAEGTLTVDEAVAIAQEAHANQLDKAGAPYIDHPLRVMDRFDDDLHQMVAVLHDVVEDACAQGFDLE